MSLAAQIARRGSTVTVMRATRARSSSGVSELVWAPVAALTGVRMLLDAPEGSTVARVFGREARVEVLAFCSQEFDVRPDDGVVVTSGWHAGRRFQAAQVVEFDQSRAHAHKELALVSTPETFA